MKRLLVTLPQGLLDRIEAYRASLPVKPSFSALVRFLLIAGLERAEKRDG